MRLFMFGSSPLKCLPRRRSRKSAESWALLPFPGPATPPSSPCTPLPEEWPEPRAGAGQLPSLPLHPRTSRASVGSGRRVTSNKRGPTPQDPPLRGSEGYFLGDVGPSAPFQVKNGREEASGNINLPTGREAPNLSGLPENPDQHVHHLLAPAAAILTVPPFPQVL